MPLEELFENFRDKYMGSQVNQMEFPDFPPDEEKRFRMIFTGTVQGVGFRYQAKIIAGKLGLTGYAKNLPSGQVLVEIQGQNNRIEHFIYAMKSIRRIYIERIEKIELPLKKEEEKFTPVY